MRRFLEIPVLHGSHEGRVGAQLQQRPQRRENQLAELRRDRAPVPLPDGESTSVRAVGREHLLHLLGQAFVEDRKSTRLNSSHVAISYAVFCLKKKTMN